VLPKAGIASFNVTPVKYSCGAKLPIGDGSIDLLLVVSVFHYWTDDVLFKTCTAELRRILKQGGRALVIDNAVDKDYHVCPRSDSEIAAALGLGSWKSEKVTINARANDHWLVDGRKT
jgi:ubiquinone/menaquinone biosynthesis C-methylase UbiE